MNYSEHDNYCVEFLTFVFIIGLIGHDNTQSLSHVRHLPEVLQRRHQGAALNFYCTTTGVRCNNKLEVLDADCKVIPGLYAAGNTVGYRYGSMHQTIIPGGTNAFATTHGYVAGESAAKA